MKRKGLTYNALFLSLVLRHLLKTWFIFLPASDLLIQVPIEISVCHIGVLVPAHGIVILK